ncbi:DUF4365 domain-containing protein [Rhodopseudomonas pseudopalustris]|uniref:DUF4365 domain-containing protein n=1 Tax=Rhodopseudomonas pseudopalustris TaxID=1513892 RepID=A0A1H8UP63_9BRAD|nr:DUF4365 domain-containing protein [Rhodopseudomonas pseudopalustris]SEP04684.1 protein of unknown function [Rhodopseudomonas pseudopalustris]
MTKKITSSQLLGEIGETSVRLRFLHIGFQFDGRSRLEAGVDGIAEVMDKGKPLARMIAVQVKATEAARYTSEDETSFSYLLRSTDLAYWRGSNLPVIIVLYRKSDDTFYWKEIAGKVDDDDRRLQFDKIVDVLDERAVDRLAALTVPKAGFGYYVPPIGGGEDALVNILPVQYPSELFVSSTPYTPKKAAAILLEGDEPRFDWAIKGETFWSFSDPRESVCRHIVDPDQVEAIATSFLAFHEDSHERNNFSFLLRKTLDHQFRKDLSWDKERKIYYARAFSENTPRSFSYGASKKRTSTEIVNVSENKIEKSKIDFVRHHAFIPRFELLYDQWYLIVSPTYFFTTNGFIPHSYPSALLAGKKRLDNSASLRGQVIMWHRFLTQSERDQESLFATPAPEQRLRFGEPPTVTLSTRVPEDVWGAQKRRTTESDDGQERMFG